MAVHIDVIAELRERRLRRDVEKLKRDAEKYGDEIGRKIGKGVERAYRGVEQANTRLAKSNDNLKKTTEASTAAQERHTIAHRNWEAAQVRHAKAAREAAAAQAVVNKMFADGVTDLDKLKAAGEDNIRTHKALVRANEALIATGFKVSESNRQPNRRGRQALPCATTPLCCARCSAPTVKSNTHSRISLRAIASTSAI
jgi:seryl-tRNA synthetase